MASLSGLESYAAPLSVRERLARGVAPLVLACAALLMLAGASAFAFGAHRTLFDTGLWWRFGLALGAMALLRRLSGRGDRLGRAARLAEGLVFVLGIGLALGEAAATLLRLAS